MDQIELWMRQALAIQHDRNLNRRIHVEHNIRRILPAPVPSIRPLQMHCVQTSVKLFPQSAMLPDPMPEEIQEAFKAAQECANERIKKRLQQFISFPSIAAGILEDL